MSEYVTEMREDDPDFSPLFKWVEENPNPGGAGFDVWKAQYMVICDRVWVGYCLPQFKDSIWGWSEYMVSDARKLVSGLFCGVCGRQEDPGCVRGC